MPTALELLDRQIAFHRVFVELTGSITGALLLSQAVYWQNRSSGWWYKTIEEWERETGMTRRELGTARKACESFLKYEVRGLPAKGYYMVEMGALEEALGWGVAAVKKLANPSLAETANPSLAETGELFGGNGQTTNIEIKSETKGNVLPPEAKLWNLICGPVLGKVLAVGGARLDHLRTRRKEPFWVGHYEEALERICASSFCRGDNGKWKVTFDWLVANPDNLAKVVEGAYDDRKKVTEKDGDWIPGTCNL